MVEVVIKYMCLSDKNIQHFEQHQYVHDVSVFGQWALYFKFGICYNLVYLSLFRA